MLGVTVHHSVATRAILWPHKDTNPNAHGDAANPPSGQLALLLQSAWSQPHGAQQQAEEGQYHHSGFCRRPWEPAHSEAMGTHLGPVEREKGLYRSPAHSFACN